jgi:conjugative relaxase-like TrwC/TraI family protein
MLSITPIGAAGAEHYYTRADEYYREHETAPSAWQGKGAGRLGLSGPVETEQFTNLLAGRTSDGSSQLIAGSRANNDQHRAGYDLTFSAPKSVSVLALAARDERLIAAHDAAVRAVLSHAESTYAETRQYVNGVQQRVLTNNWVIATYRHDLSRALDPQLHTHAIVLNATQRDDGAWRAITAEKLLSAKMELGAVYRNELANRVQQLGYQAEWGERGFFEIRGVDQRTLNAFSRRAEQIDAAAERLKAQHPEVDESKIREWATLASRAAKESGIDREILRADWQARVPQVRDLSAVVAQARERADGRAFTREGQGMSERGGDARDIARLAAQRLTEAESVFTRQQWIETASQLAAGKATTSELSQAMDRLSNGRADRAECPRLQTRANGERLYTTQAIYHAEREVLDYARAGRGQQQSIVDPERAEALLSERGLSADQHAAAKAMLTSQDKLLLVQGDAGTGKTTMLRSVREVAEAEGWTVSGLAYTGQASKELREGAGIEADTLHWFLGRSAEQGAADQSRQPRQLWIVDESSMTGSRQLHALITSAEQHQAKLALVGDSKQLSAIGAGRLFAELQERGAAEIYHLTEIKRQTEPGYKQAAEALAQKQLDQAFTRLAQDGRLHEYAAHSSSIHQQIAHEYAERTAAGRDTLAVSLYRDDARELNHAIRAELQQRSLIGGENQHWQTLEAKNLGPIEKGFAASYQGGDTLVCLAPHKDHDGLGWKPGAVATVTAIDRSTHTLTVAATDGRGTTETRQIQLTRKLEPNGKQQADLFASYEARESAFSRGDTVVFLKNDRQLDVRNGQRGEILNVSAQHMTVKMTDGSTRNFGSSEYRYLAHGYAMTDYKSQGSTTQTVLVHADAAQRPRMNAEGHEAAPRANFQSLYVAMTRGREDVQLWTPNLGQLRARASEVYEKTSTASYSERDRAQQQQKTDERDQGRQGERAEASRSASRGGDGGGRGGGGMGGGMGGGGGGGR